MNSIDALKACMTTDCDKCPLFEVECNCGIAGSDKKVYPNELIRMIIKEYEDMRCKCNDRQTV